MNAIKLKHGGVINFSVKNREEAQIFSGYFYTHNKFFGNNYVITIDKKLFLHLTMNTNPENN